MTLRTLTVTVALLAAVPLSAQRPADGDSSRTSTTDYVIGPQDILTITSYDEADVSGKFVVERDGTFTFPMVGRVKAGGLTLRELETMLEYELVAGGFFTNPDVRVAVDQYRSQKIFILGEVRKPGVYELSGSMRLVEALALADSTLPTASGEIVIVPHAEESTGEGTRQTVRLSLSDLENGRSLDNVALQDGDTILVPRAEDVYVFGQVKSPGAYPMRQDDMTVLQALSLAGGITDRGAMGRIEIIRVVSGQKKEIRAELGDVVHEGDTIVVPERFF